VSVVAEKETKLGPWKLWKKTRDKSTSDVSYAKKARKSRQRQRGTKCVCEKKNRECEKSKPKQTPTYRPDPDTTNLTLEVMDSTDNAIKA